MLKQTIHKSINLIRKVHLCYAWLQCSDRYTNDLSKFRTEFVRVQSQVQCTCTLLIEVIQIMTEIQIPENVEEETPVLWCQSKWHDMTHFSSGLLYMLRCWFFPPFTICGAHNIRILELGKHLTQEFELYNLYPVFLPVTQFARIWKMRNIFNCISHFLQLKKFLSES